MNKTGIKWTKLTWNVWSGCDKISPACKFCYAERIAEAKAGTKAFPNGFGLTMRKHKLREPFQQKDPALIFVNSMSDLFWEKVTDRDIEEVVEVIRATPQHQYQALTKRPERMAEFFKTREVPSNMWLGVSVESPKYTTRIETLRGIDAEIRFISAEPILEDLGLLDLSGISWLISGGESGNHLTDYETARKRGLVFRHPKEGWTIFEDRKDWIRSLRDQCTENAVAFFHKQWGGYKDTCCGNDLDGVKWEEFPRYHDEERGEWFERDQFFGQAARGVLSESQAA